MPASLHCFGVSLSSKLVVGLLPWMAMLNGQHARWSIGYSVSSLGIGNTRKRLNQNLFGPNITMQFEIRCRATEANPSASHLRDHLWGLTSRYFCATYYSIYVDFKWHDTSNERPLISFGKSRIELCKCACCNFCFGVLSFFSFLARSCCGLCGGNPLPKLLGSSFIASSLSRVGRNPPSELINVI